MRIYNLRKKTINSTSILTASIQSEKLGEKELWFSTDTIYEDYVSENHYDAFLVGILYPAMKYGENIHINGKVSKKLLFNINNYAIPLIKSFSPSCKLIKVTATEQTSEILEGEGVGTGFSGGVDSFCTIYDHYELENDPEYKINSFLFLNVGAHGSKDENKIKEKFNLRYDYLKKFPNEIGLEFIQVDSNLFEFHPWGHQLTCSLTLVAGILFLQNYYNKYYCASLGWSYLEIFKYYETDLDKDIAMFDPILLPLLSTESLEIIPDGTQYTRTEKTIRILDYEPVQKYLNVCVSGDDTHENCSACGKCTRTLMTINSVNKLEQFSHLFDIDKYKNDVEKKYVREQVLKQNSDPFAKGNVKLARANNVDLPNYINSFVLEFPSKLKAKIKRTLKK